QILDNLWREHLYQMDILKTGIGLRSYNQKDPLVEYKKESYNLFMELVERIKFDSLKLLFNVVFTQQQAQNFEEKSHDQNEQFLSNTTESGVNENGEAQITKVPRNSPCPCGSGKKYKECHGKSGPKKGILA
ncbi:preprotein translocase subunit SecA, partial [Campylobacter lari]|nr:preprotein translocase subunit SecA [Campylobacter lari]